MKRAKFRCAGLFGQVEDQRFGSCTVESVRVNRRRLSRDGCSSRKGIVSLPICKITLKAIKPSNKPYPKEIKTIGDQIKKRRLDLNLRQIDLAMQLNVSVDTIRNWEFNRSTPNHRKVDQIMLYIVSEPHS